MPSQTITTTCSAKPLATAWNGPANEPRRRQSKQENERFMWQENAKKAQGMPAESGRKPRTAAGPQPRSGGAMNLPPQSKTGLVAHFYEQNSVVVCRAGSADGRDGKEFGGNIANRKVLV